MAWNDPPSFDYQQLSNPGRKFKHRYVLETKLGQPQTQLPNYNQYAPQPSSTPMQVPSYTNYTTNQGIPPNWCTIGQPDYSNNSTIMKPTEAVCPPQMLGEKEKQQFNNATQHKI